MGIGSNRIPGSGAIAAYGSPLGHAGIKNSPSEPSALLCAQGPTLKIWTVCSSAIFFSIPGISGSRRALFFERKKRCALRSASAAVTRRLGAVDISVYSPQLHELVVCARQPELVRRVHHRRGLRPAALLRRRDQPVF